MLLKLDFSLTKHISQNGDVHDVTLMALQQFNLLVSKLVWKAADGTLTEQSGNEGHAVGQHSALDDVQVRQHEEYQQTGADSVQRLEDRHPYHVSQRRPLP